MVKKGQCDWGMAVTEMTKQEMWPRQAQGGCVLAKSLSRHSKESIFQNIYNWGRTQWMIMRQIRHSKENTSGVPKTVMQEWKNPEMRVLGNAKWTGGHSDPWLLQTPPAGILEAKPGVQGCLHQLVEGLRWRECQVQPGTSSILGPGSLSLSEPQLSSGSLCQGSKCHWAEQPPKEKLLGGDTDSPTGQHTPLHPWRGRRLESLRIRMDVKKHLVREPSLCRNHLVPCR
jgi:hypothetical protein